MRPTATRVQRYVAAGMIFATLGLYGILHVWSHAGEPLPPSMSNTRFSVAILSGAKQAAQTAPKDAYRPRPVAVTRVPATAAPIVVPELATRLPSAVSAAQDTSPGRALPKPDEVIPPANVSMPGGRLAVEDPGQGDLPDPFALGPRQVYVRLKVAATGKVTEGEVVRHGPDVLRDALILRALRSRTYATDRLLRVGGGEPSWQLDLVVDYGTNEFLP